MGDTVKSAEFLYEMAIGDKEAASRAAGGLDVRGFITPHEYAQQLKALGADNATINMIQQKMSRHLVKNVRGDLLYDPAVLTKALPEIKSIVAESIKSRSLEAEKTRPSLLDLLG